MEDSGSEEQWLYGDSNDNDQANPSQDENSQTEDDDLKHLYSDKECDTLDKSVVSCAEEESDAALETACVPGESADKETDVVEEGQLSGDEAEGEGDSEEYKNGVLEPGEGNQDNSVGEDEEDSEDDVQVTIGDIKTSPAAYGYGGGTPMNFNIKRGGHSTPASIDKPKVLMLPSVNTGGVSLGDLEAGGTINGVPAHEYNLDSLEEKPWRKPGADITDYFNFGFTEDTWRAYCDRQKRMRTQEAGVGLPGMQMKAFPTPATGGRKAGPPPGRRIMGTIDVIGGSTVSSRRSSEKTTSAKENSIEVMTADKREYSRKVLQSNFPDLSVPPPGYDVTGIMAFNAPPPVHAPPPHGSYGGDYYPPDADPYYQSYEPTQDTQWMQGQDWEHSNSSDVGHFGSNSHSFAYPDGNDDGHVKDRSTRDDRKDRDRDRGRDRDRDREREDRHRSRRKSRSRSRSPNDRRSSRHHRSRSTSRHKDRDKDKDRKDKKRDKKDKDENKDTDKADRPWQKSLSSSEDGRSKRKSRKRSSEKNERSREK